MSLAPQRLPETDIDEDVRQLRLRIDARHQSSARPPVARPPVTRPPAAAPPKQAPAPITAPAPEEAPEPQFVRRSIAAEQSKSHWIYWAMLVSVLLVWGQSAHLERYITPQRGLGYALGIVGGSMMVLLLLYSARKRASWLRWMGSIPSWFRIHMTLGVVGPVLILFHSNFKLGATNSNVALISMLLVAGSGVIGRYIYTRIHARLDGNQDSLEDLQDIAERIRAQTTQVAFLPALLDVIDREEQRLVHASRGAIGRLLLVFTAGSRAAVARWRLHGMIRRAVKRAASHESGSIASHARKLERVACAYADRRLDAARRVTEYGLYARLFSFWHVLHIPLFFMLLLAAIAHVIAVNLY